MKKKFLMEGIGLLTLSLLLIPSAAYAAGDLGQVHVTVENTTYTVSEGAPWEGVLVDTWVDLESDSTMMTCIYEALGSYESIGADDTYISEINGLAEFDGGSESGWMGTLNDWFTNEGFAEFKVSQGELEDGDEIHVMYTCSYGEDLGSSFTNTSKNLKELNFNVGTLTPAFDSNTYEYTLTVPEGTTEVKVTPSAVNKNFQVRTYKGESEYRRTEYVPVESGDILNVKVGDPSWPGMTMTNTPPETYIINVVVEEPEPEPPAAPVLGTAKNTASGVSVTWNEVEGADVYRVYRKTGSGSWTRLQDVTTLSYLDTGAAAGATVTYTVRCRRDGLWSTYDKTGKTIVRLTQPALKLANTSSGVKITWGKVAGATKYYIYRKTGSGSWVNQGGTTSLSFTDTKATSGTTYYYTVRAFRGTYNSAFDTTKQIMRLAQPKVTVAKVSGGIKVSWGKIGGAKNYYVYRKTGASGSWTRLSSVTGTTYTDKTARTKTTYYYTVRAINGSNTSSFTASKSIRR